jgi:hypothetical protein
MRSLVLIAAASTALAVRPADACSISPNPSAHIFRPASGQPGGHRPFISLWRTTKPVTVMQVKPNCIQDTICKGTPVEVERVGTFLRPKAALPDGARIQITHDGKLLADATIATGTSALPAWDGIEWVSAKQEKEGLCSPAGPVVRLKVKPTKAKLDDAYLLVYTSKPDPAKPLAGLSTMFALYTADIEIGNGFGTPDLFKGVPKQIFVRLADGEGNLGPVIKLGN